MPDTQRTTVVASFSNRDVAHRALYSLRQSGVPSADVHLHEKGMQPRNADGVMLDEYATGGFFTNFAHLLDGLMGTPRKSPSYDELVQFEGVVVSVQVTGEDAIAQVEGRLRTAGAEKVSSGRGLDRL